MKSVWGSALAGVLCLIAHAAPKPPDLRLPETVTPVSYRAELTLTPGKPAFSGKIEIKVNVQEPVQTVWLNAKKIEISEATFHGAGKTYTAKPVPGGDEFIGLDFSAPLPAGSGEIVIAYTGGVRQQDSSGVFQMVDNGNNYIYMQFEPTDARGAFPCFDEPNYKVPWQLTLSVPSDDTAVSNTPILKQEKHGEQTTYFFKQTKPLPSYLVAFAIGPFDYVDAGTAGKNHIPVRIVTPKGHADEAKYAAEVTSEIITHEETYFGIPFPYEKSDQMAIPVTFGFGAMENAGMVTYAQNIILSKASTDNTLRQRGYYSVAAHELAHQWFGDLVTTAWWNDIWLNEAFATWMEQKLLRESKPEWNTAVDDASAKLYAESQDSLVTARKIRQEIKTKDDIGNAFDGITYQKGAAVIGMFENYVGQESFRKGVQGYLKQYAFRNASGPEFLDSISTASKKNMTAMFSTFLNQAGVPLVSVALDCKQGQPSLHLEQERFVPLGTTAQTGQLWQIPVCVRYGTGNAGETACLVMTEAKQDLALKGTACPAWVEANDRAIGYYRVDYKRGLSGALIKDDVSSRLSAAERADFMGNASSLESAGKLAAADALSLVQTFAGDRERHVVQSALELALAPQEHEVPDNLMANYQRFLLKCFDARAKQTGWTAKPNESDDVALLRPTLVRMMATYGGNNDLARQGTELANKWLTDPSSVDATVATSVLRTAAFYGDKALFERFQATLKVTTDRQARGRIIYAMENFRDPALITAGFEAVLSGDVPFIEGGRLLFSGQQSSSTRPMALQFLKAHFEEIMAKRPSSGGFDEAASLPYVGDSYCDATSKAQLSAFFTPRLDQLPGAKRNLANVLESIDDCIAQKAAQEPSVAAFLAKY